MTNCKYGASPSPTQLPHTRTLTLTHKYLLKPRSQMQVKIYESCRAAFDNGALACSALECTFVCQLKRSARRGGVADRQELCVGALENVCLSTLSHNAIRLPAGQADRPLPFSYFSSCSYFLLLFFASLATSLSLLSSTSRMCKPAACCLLPVPAAKVCSKRFAVFPLHSPFDPHPRTHTHAHRHST